MANTTGSINSTSNAGASRSSNSSRGMQQAMEPS